MVNGQHAQEFVRRLVRYMLCALCAGVWVVGCCALWAAESVDDAARGFTLDLPDGFRAAPEVARKTPGIVHAFVYEGPTQSQLKIMLLIKQLPGTIGRERLTPDHLPPGFQGKLFTVRWQGFEVDGFEVPENLGGMATVTYNVQIPLKQAAIQLMVFGPKDRARELKQLLDEILQGLRGESNWLASAGPSDLVSTEGYGVVLLVIGGLAVLGGLVVLWLISRKAPKGAVLAIAVVIYAASWGVDTVQVREIALLSGVLKTLGVTGAIVGLIDILRKRKVSKSAAPSGDAPSEPPSAS